mmetsp:Transcript_5645/g.10886  ORF Transcript_5645/g.10886 Transcript_5645/m.10886 type:complete len:591 (-) Transcript_5645:2217-3989(-)
MKSTVCVSSVMHVFFLLLMVDVESSIVQKKLGKAAEEWAHSSARPTKEHVNSGAPQEYEYVYLDEDGNYYEANEGDDEGDEEEDVDEDDEEEDDEEVKFVPPPPRQTKNGYKVVPPTKPPPPPRPYSRMNTLREIEDISSCLPRNHTYMKQLRDDHQLNLKQEKELKKERRKQKREKKAQELSDLEEEKDEKRHKMSRMNSNEMFEEEAQNERIEKAKLQKKAEEEELERVNSKTLNVGDKVMARYQRKAKYLFGKITAVRKDGMFNIKYDNGKEEMGVDKSLIIKPESQREIVRGTKIGVNEEQKAQALSMKEQQKQELLEMQERQEQLLAEELAAQAERDKDPGRRMGADCESQACGSCKLIVEEFAHRVHRNINNKDVQTLDAVFDYMTPFCSSPQIKGKYSKVVEVVCDKMFTMRDHREFFIREFEADSNWDNVLNPDTLLLKKQKICQTSGFCEDDSFEYTREEDDCWGSDECFVCHALMEDLEEKATLYDVVSEDNSPEIAKHGCDNLFLEPEFAEECRKILSGMSLIEVSWLIKLHYEQIRKKKVTFRSFPDISCEKLSLCKRWIDPDTELTSVLDEVEHVFA